MSAWILVAGLALAASIFCAALLVAAKDWQANLQASQGKAALLARVLADQSARTLDTGLLALRTVATLPALRSASTHRAQAEHALAQMIVGTPFMRDAAVIDPMGKIVASTDSASAGQFIDLRKLGVRAAEGKEAVGTVVAGRGFADLARNATASVAPKGLSFIPLAVGFVGESGQAWMVVGTLNPDYLANLQVLAIGTDSLHSIVTTYEGSVLAASSAWDVQAKSSLAALPVFQTYLPSREFGTYVGQGSGSEKKILAFRASRRQPVVAIVEQSYASAQSQWLESVRSFAGIGAVAILFVLGLTVVASRSLRAREVARKQASAAQARSMQNEQELAGLMQSIQELIFRTDPAGVLTLVNAHWAPLSGRRVEDAIGRALRDLVDVDDQHKIDALFDPTGAAVSRSAHVRFRLSKERTLRLKVAVVPLRQEGVLVGFAGSAVDVTERWLAQQQLQAQLAYHDRLLETNPLPISLTDLSGRLVQVNRAWEIYQGKTRNQVLGKQLGHVLPPHEARVHHQADEELLRNGGDISFETVVSHGDGTQRETRVIKTVVPDETGNVTGILCTLMDISDFREAERATREGIHAAEEAHRSKSEFVANMSHELRTPLQSIIGFSELGMLRSQPMPKFNSMFHDIHNAGQRMLALVNDLLDVAKLESTVGTFHLERIDLRSLIHPVTREFEPLLAKAQVHLAVQLANVPVLAKADPIRFQQVIRNILANAMKVSSPGQTINLTCELDAEGQPHIEVRDEGPGIPEGELQSIFEAFVQSSKTNDGAGGTGLGLAICRKIVEALGGTIYARNSVAGGAVFHIVLPRRGFAETIAQPLE
jgi:PAS domain S-box-containing protein